ncbi:MAG: Transcriptional regulator, MarR family, partial [uncultured Nocardioides sp.]
GRLVHRQHSEVHSAHDARRHGARPGPAPLRPRLRRHGEVREGAGPHRSPCPPPVGPRPVRPVHAAVPGAGVGRDAAEHHRSRGRPRRQRARDTPGTSRRPPGDPRHAHGDGPPHHRGPRRRARGPGLPVVRGRPGRPPRGLRCRARRDRGPVRHADGGGPM